MTSPIKEFLRRALPSIRQVQKFTRTVGVFFLLCATTFYSFGGLDLYLGLKTPFAPNIAGAAYSGKKLHTVEYILGGGTEGSSAATNVITYFGSGTSTTKIGAGTKSVVLEGTNISVKNAYLDVSYITATAANVTHEAIVIDVTGSSAGGSDAQVGESLATIMFANSGLSGYIRHTHDVTSFFDRQTDANWQSGVAVVAGVTVTGPTRALTTVKLVVTYENDYSVGTHNETKTVRFPLSSTAANDRGTRGTTCAAAATCSFLATSTIPDAVANADILDVYVEMHGEVNSGTASNFRVGIRGGSGTNATSSPFNWTEALTDDTVVSAIWSPSVAAPNFQRNATMTFDALMGTVAMNALGGELVVTYRYSTGATAQTETVRYIIGQDTVGIAVAKNNFITITPTISNSSMSMKNIWLKAHIAATTTSIFTVYGTVGTSSEVSRGINIAATVARAGDDQTMLLDLSDRAGNFFNSTTTIAAATQSSAGEAPTSVEAYFTFTWNGSLGGTQTQTVSFSGAQQGVSGLANVWNNRPAPIDLPETVAKTYRSAYLETKFMHSQAANIIVGTVIIGVNGSTTAITESADTVSEAYTSTYLIKIASTTFSNGDTIAWTSRVIEINETKSVADSASFGNQVIVTYDVDLAGADPVVYPKQLRTVEYTLGGGTENTAQGTTITSYFGSSISTTKATAGLQAVTLEGRNIRVVNAYLDVGVIAAAASNISALGISIDVGGSSSGGTDVQAGEAAGAFLLSNTQPSGYIHGTHDVTAFFGQASDANWSTGVSVVAGASTTLSVGNRALTTMKLVITYESDYYLVAHNEVKTVRFPLHSTNGTDLGTRQAQCAAAATCSFTYTANIPDAILDADILDAHFDLHADVDSAVASTMQAGIRGGTASSSAYNWVEVLTDDSTINVTYEPLIGSPNFQRNTAQTLDVKVGTVPLNALGGELVVTYRYSTGQAVQTETVQYFINQDAVSAGVASSTFASTTATISNGGLLVKNIWYKIHTAPYQATNIVIASEVGTATKRFANYAFTAGNQRAGDTPTIIHDMSGDIANFYTSTTTLGGESRATVTNAPVGVEAFITFTWSGSLGGTSTRSVLYSGAQQGTNNIISASSNRPVRIELTESVTKTFRSAYLQTSYLHSGNGGNFTTLGTLTFGANGSTSAITEAGDTEQYNARYLNNISSSTFSNGNTIPWKMRYIEVSNVKDVTNYAYFNNVVVVTYDAAQQYKFPKFTQNYYRFYFDNGALKPVAAWTSGTGGTLGENTEITAADSPPGNGANLRIRMSLQVATTTMLASSTQFKLQFAKRVSACAAIGSWTDIGASGSGTIWRGFNATPVDGTNLSLNPPTGGDLVLSVSARAGLYQESNNAVLNPFAVSVGENVEYDWNVQDNGAATDTPYCFRMANADGSAFDTYANYPALITQGYTAESRNWRFYDDETNETPLTALAGENSAPTNLESNNIVKLRMTLNETAGSNGVNQKFRLQYSTFSDFSQNVNFVVATSSCVILSMWCYGNGVDTDDDAITTRVLTDSTANGRHNEAPTTTSTMSPLATTATEFEFTLKYAGRPDNVTYFFRAYDVNHSRAVALATLKTYPSISTAGAELTYTISGLATSTVTEGITTDLTTTASAIPFNTVPIGTSGLKAAQRITVSTNATEGYQVFLKGNASMLSSLGALMPDVTGTNATPSAWATGCLSTASGCWGYHAGDDTLSGSTRFLVNDTYARVATTSLEEVIYNSGPVTNDINDEVFRLEVHQQQSAGNYTTQMEYIVVPIF